MTTGPSTGGHAPLPDEPPFDPDYDTPHRPSNGSRPPGLNAPAQDVSAERAALGAMLLTPQAITDVTALIGPDDYYRPNHALIHTAITTLAADGTRVDPITVAAHLAANGHARQAGDPLYLVELQQACPLPANAAHYAETVLTAAKRRAIYDLGGLCRQLGASGSPQELEGALTVAYERLDATAARFGAPQGGTITGLVALDWLHNGTTPHIPPPTRLQRADGHAIFYDGRINGLFGDPEVGKTFVGLAAEVEALNQGGTAAIVDIDDNGPERTVARLIALGANPSHLADPRRFRYYRPESADQLRAACRDLVSHPADIAILDSIGELVSMLAAKGSVDEEVTAAIRTTLVPIANAGTCVITVDHLPKSAESRATGFAIGTIAKKRMMRGSYLRVEARQQPAPGKTGRLTLMIEKDTDGKLREVSGGKYAGTFVLDSTTPDRIRWEVNTVDNPVADDGTFRPTHHMEAVSRFVEENDNVTQASILEHVRGKSRAIVAAIQCLVNEGYLTTLPGPRNATLHHCVATYREAEDDQS